MWREKNIRQSIVHLAPETFESLMMESSLVVGFRRWENESGNRDAKSEDAMRYNAV